MIQNRFSRTYKIIDSKIEITPIQQLVFYFEDDGKTKTLTASEDLIIRNVSNRLLRYKIRSTSPFHYIVKPSEEYLDPGNSVEVSVKMILGDRDIQKFSMDKFEILTKFVNNEREIKDKQFWNDAKGYRLSVRLAHRKQPPPKKNDYHQYQQQKQHHIPNAKVHDLQRECEELQKKIKLIKDSERHYQPKFLQTKNYIIAAIISFVLGFLFA